MQAKVGDTVRFLNSVGGGRVVRIDGQIAYVDEDGFETPALLRECVVVASDDSFYQQKENRAVKAALAPKPENPSKPKTPSPQIHVQAPALPPLVETPEGEKLNIVLGFEASDIKRLSDTTFDAMLVNDSNYYLSLLIATRPSDSQSWTLRFRGIVEPQMQEFVFELATADLAKVDRIAVQAVAFKSGTDFTLKNPVAYEQRFDATKLARLHCFSANPYFDTSVVAINIVSDDVTQGRLPAVNPDELAKAMKEKQLTDKPRRQQVKKTVDPTKPLEVDLHISELLDSTAGMSKADILNHQIDTFRSVMDANLRYPGRAIIFIHGKGEGVLRQALMKELNHRYKSCEVSDASFREYGFGATKVVIRR